MPQAECVIFDNCGHFMAIDEPIKTARTILTFFDDHANYQVKLLSVMNIRGVDSSTISMTNIRLERAPITDLSTSVMS